MYCDEPDIDRKSNGKTNKQSQSIWWWQTTKYREKNKQMSLQLF